MSTSPHPGRHPTGATPIGAGTIGAEIGQTKPFESLAQEATVGVLRTASLIERSVNRVLAPSGLSQQQYNVLRILRGAGTDGLPTLEIRRRMITDSPAITRLLKKLESAGLVGRERPASSQRQVICRLTSAGAALVERLHHAVNAADAAAARPLDETDLATLIVLLDRVRAGLRTAEATGSRAAT